MPRNRSRKISSLRTPPPSSGLPATSSGQQPLLSQLPALLKRLSSHEPSTVPSDVLTELRGLASDLNLLGVEAANNRAPPPPPPSEPNLLSQILGALEAGLPLLVKGLALL